jgi:hypothetical protein
MSGQMKSIPATSRPTIRAASSAISMLSGWASKVRSIEIPPVDMLPVSANRTITPSAGTESGSSPDWSSTSIGGGVDLDPGEDLLVAHAAARVGVGEVDELLDRVLAVTGRPWAGTRSAIASIRPLMIRQR